MAVTAGASAQTDLEPPAAPVMDLVTVSQVTGFSELSWTLSPSPDVSGYVVYLYVGNEGYAIDTIHNSLISDYTHTSLISSELSRSYVVAAIDSAGNISTLSNALSTIFTTAKLDSCNGTIEIRWNSYHSYPREVESYSILLSRDEGSFSEAATVNNDVNSFILDDFSYNSRYCFAVKANLKGGYSSFSNKSCLSTKMQRPPLWINADYATVVNGNDIMLSFRVDPGSEISSYILERKTGSSGSLSEIYHFEQNSESFLFNDAEADVGKVNYYRLSAVNNCDIPATVSNIASNIVTDINRQGDIISLRWNPYEEWNGTVESYMLLVKTSGEYEENRTIVPPDTSVTIRYSDLMYEVTGNEVCFMIEAHEAANPYGISGESRSSEVCTDVTEVVTVPDLFTPDNNLINDLFTPVLSFTPVSYHLLVTDLRRKPVFETRDHTQKWDGTRNGSPLPEGVYLWFLEVSTPSGKNVSRTGTVTIARPGG